MPLQKDIQCHYRRTYSAITEGHTVPLHKDIQCHYRRTYSATTQGHTVPLQKDIQCHSRRTYSATTEGHTVHSRSTTYCKTWAKTTDPLCLFSVRFTAKRGGQQLQREISIPYTSKWICYGHLVVGVGPGCLLFCLVGFVL